jgi:hypothetical protein
METYIGSLLEPGDVMATGLYPATAGSAPIFFGNVVVRTAITFPDGSVQTSAGVALPSVIDTGVF